MKPTKQQIETLAEWWAIKTFDIRANQDNGDTSENGGVAFMLMNMVAMNAKDSMPENARQKFKDSIIERLSSTDDNSYYSYMLDVDYHPNQMLLEICEKANVNTSALPVKTFTTWDNGKNKFIGKFQYGGEFEEIA